MGAAIGGRLIVMVAITIRTLRHTAAHITATVIITARLIMTTTLEPMVGMGALMVRTDRHIGELVTILTREPTHEAVRFRLLMAPEVQHKRIIHTPAPTRRRDKVRVQQLNGAVRMFREETRALPRVIIPQLMER